MASPDIPDCGSPAAVLAFARQRRADAHAAEVDVVRAALAWADLHPAESVEPGPVFGWELVVPLAGEGAPEVAEFAPMELGAALGISTDSARGLMADALELAHRLKRTWRLVQAGKVPLWKARRLAQLTHKLSLDGATYVDRRLAAVAGKVGLVTLARLVDEAQAMFDPNAAEKARLAAAESRRFNVHTEGANHDGTIHVEGDLDLADALDLEAAIAQRAEELHQLGSIESLDVRRSIAAGELARRCLGLDHATEDGSASGTTSVVKPRRVVIHVHLSAAAISRDEAGVAHVDETRSVISTDQVRDWCGNPDTEVVIKPVIDLDEHHHTDAYAIPDRMAEQLHLTQPSCAFPWCDRPSRRCDTDHVTAHDKSGSDGNAGPTCSCNLAPLCRRHHRAKTHTAWTYDKADTATYLWRSPHGLHLAKHRGETRLVTAHSPGR
ncbi:HNH endonuclease [Nocardioides sp. dk4132]|uniref:HNH endonuclease signature motif containing protein n=1 Tax=unclassified Nocardioides TaxID=2615069 RepID=UPI00129787B2|nr:MULTISPECIES: HNH endonuclease signature motif containing protein [unclassified Nocardioides]MQW76600.1 HNH endonuclease [Nocardioides sp. dk4132]QGA07028.1 HNH endonuclease [Nocardioides sp. dk884]